MKRPIVIALLFFATATAFATSPALRVAAIDQLRSIAQPLFEKGEATEPRFDAFYAAMVEGLPPQQRAERALELAINRYEGASEYVIRNAPGWRGQFQSSDQLATLLNTAQNSRLIEVRMAGFELQLAASDLQKSAAEVERLQQRLSSDAQRSGPWALWNLGTLAARGVERERVFQTLLQHARHPDEEVRRWAVEGLSRMGGVEVVEPLLLAAEGDESAFVRERAFCALAQSGTLHIAERYEAVPGLLRIAGNPQSSQQTVDWSYQALREITNLYDLPNDSLRWRAELDRAGLLHPEGQRPQVASAR